MSDGDLHKSPLDRSAYLGCGQQIRPINGVLEEMFATRVENLGKQYRIGGPPTPLRCGDSLRSQERYKTVRESLTEAVQAPFRRMGKLLRGQAYGAAEQALLRRHVRAPGLRRGRPPGAGDFAGGRGAGGA